MRYQANCAAQGNIELLTSIHKIVAANRISSKMMAIDGQLEWTDSNSNLGYTDSSNFGLTIATPFTSHRAAKLYSAVDCFCGEPCRTVLMVMSALLCTRERVTLLTQVEQTCWNNCSRTCMVIRPEACSDWLSAVRWLSQLHVSMETGPTQENETQQ